LRKEIKGEERTDIAKREETRNSTSYIRATHFLLS
jgi:hypothetical protein